MFTPTAEKLMPDLTPARSSSSWPAPCGGRATTTTWPATSRSTSATARCCAIRGCSRGTSSARAGAAHRPRRQRRSRGTGRCRSGSPCTSSCTGCGRDVGWALHNHPLFGTVWADLAELPPILDQSSALGGGDARRSSTSTTDRSTTPRARGGPSSRWARPPWRCSPGTASSSWGARPGPCTSGRSRSSSVASTPGTPAAAGGSGDSRVPQAFLDFMAGSDGEGFVGFWEAAVRAELAADPDLLD